MYVFNGRYDEAILQAEKLLALDPNMRISIELKALVSWHEGRLECCAPFVSANSSTD